VRDIKRAQAHQARQASSSSSAWTAASAWASGAWSTGGNAESVCVCEAAEGYSLSNVILFGSLLALILLGLWYVVKPKPKPIIQKSKKIAKSMRGSVTYCPDPEPIVYFSTTAIVKSRCYHADKDCRGLLRATSVCSAVACKMCVGNITHNFQRRVVSDSSPTTE
jgi:hypothetical protein